jgi:hypothetical protein
MVRNVSPEPWVIRPPDDWLAQHPHLTHRARQLSIQYAHRELVTEAALAQMGGALWHALAMDEAFDQRAAQAGMQILPLIVESADPTVLYLPWECLCHPQAGFLGRHELDRLQGLREPLFRRPASGSPRSSISAAATSNRSPPGAGARRRSTHGALPHSHPGQSGPAPRHGPPPHVPGGAPCVPIFSMPSWHGGRPRQSAPPLGAEIGLRVPGASRVHTAMDVQRQLHHVLQGAYLPEVGLRIPPPALTAWAAGTHRFQRLLQSGPKSWVHYTEHPPASIKEAMAKIEALTGIRRSENRYISR